MKCANCSAGDPTMDGFTVSYYGDQVYTVNFCRRCAVRLLGSTVYALLRRASTISAWKEPRLPTL